MTANSFHTSGSSPTRRLRIGLLGFGTVGSAIARRLVSDPSLPLELTHVFDRRAAFKAARFLAGVPAAPRLHWSDRVGDLLASGADILVEAIGGAGDAYGWTCAALRAGKSVVTCNKQLVAAHGPALFDLAARQGRQLRYEAAVGGAMPIVGALGGLAGDRLVRITGILNGTTNAVLSDMERGRTMADALDAARARGYAEADASSDLDGTDARAKLAILCAAGFGLRVEPGEIEAQSAAGITPDDFARAARGGNTIRQLACAACDETRSTLTAWVAPAPVARASLFGSTRGPQNAAVVTGVYAGDITMGGAGAGGEATAVAALGDLLAIARDPAAILPAPRLSRPGRVLGLATSASAGEARRVYSHIEAEAV
ncbi:MAG: homoserine dehydrogenase [Acidobacteria bacterium]|nr:homoserine dehydrogenase [Acidobacteriota bacterium]